MRSFSLILLKNSLFYLKCVKDPANIKWTAKLITFTTSFMIVMQISLFPQMQSPLKFLTQLYNLKIFLHHNSKSSVTEDQEFMLSGMCC